MTFFEQYRDSFQNLMIENRIFSVCKLYLYELFKVVVKQFLKNIILNCMNFVQLSQTLRRSSISADSFRYKRRCRITASN